MFHFTNRTLVFAVFFFTMFLFGGSLPSAKLQAQTVDIGWPFPPCETWYVLQGYYSDAPKSHQGTYAFDLLKDSPQNDSTTGLATVVAPMSGKIGSIYTINTNGLINWGVRIDNGAYQFRLNHLEEPTTISVGQSVMKGDYIGRVFNQPLGGYKHLDITLNINGERVPLDVTGTVWQFPANGPRPSSWGTWAGTKLEASCQSADLLFYTSTEGRAELYRTGTQGDLSELKVYPSWQKTWSMIIPGKCDSDSFTDLLLYDATQGRAEIYRTDGQGGLGELQVYPNWRKTWSAIVPGKFDDDKFTDLLLYDSTEGRAEIYRTNGQGGLVELRTYPIWRKTWSAIIPGNFDGDSFTDLLLYDASEGRAEIYRTDGQGGLTELKTYTWRTTWSTIVPGNFDSDNFTDLLLYDNTEGRAEIYRTDGQGGLIELRVYPEWRKTWSAIVPGNYNGDSYTDLVLYDATRGNGELYSTDGQGGLILGRTYTWRTDWSLLVFDVSSSMTQVRQRSTLVTPTPVTPTPVTPTPTPSTHKAFLPMMRR